MRKRVFSSLTILALTACVAWASGSPWKGKPYQQWNDQDIRKVLVESPWGHVVSGVGGAWSPMGYGKMANTSNLSGQVAGTGNNVGTLPAEHDASTSNPNAPRTYEVFWWSSRTIREAVARRAMLHSGMSAAEAAQFVNATMPDYEILVQGPDMRDFAKGTPQEYMKKAFLELKKPKARIEPSKVEFKRGPDGHSVVSAIFYFPRKDASGQNVIPAGEKEVDFYCSIGAGTLRTGFNPRKMVVGKNPDM